MYTYLIAYDLHSEPPSVYDALIEALDKAGAIRAQKSVWVLQSPYTSEQNYNWFIKYMRAKDELIVTEVKIENTWITKDSNSMGAFDLLSFVRLLTAALK